MVGRAGVGRTLEPRTAWDELGPLEELLRHAATSMRLGRSIKSDYDHGRAVNTGWPSERAVVGPAAAIERGLNEPDDEQSHLQEVASWHAIPVRSQLGGGSCRPFPRRGDPPRATRCQGAQWESMKRAMPTSRTMPDPVLEPQTHGPGATSAHALRSCWGWVERIYRASLSCHGCMRRYLWKAPSPSPSTAYAPGARDRNSHVGRGRNH